MNDATTLELYRFLRRRGWSAANALHSAKAHTAFVQAGGEFAWVADDDADFSFVDDWSKSQQKAFWDKDHTTEGCIATHPTLEKYTVSLWGIIDADNDYRREIEAEFSGEALHALANSGKACCVTCHQQL